MKAPINCTYSDVWPLSKFVNHPKNPNRHSHEQIALLASIIQTHGWRRPIVVSSRSGLIVKGHGRLMAAKVAGLTEAPVEIQDYANEAAELSDLLADNRIAEFSDTDSEALRGLLDDIKAADVSLSLAGFSEKALAGLLSGMGDDKPEEETAEETPRAQRIPRVGARVMQYNLVFADEHEQQRWFGVLRSLAVRFPQKETIGDRLIALVAPPAS
jgi:ParB-like chromosome segregation protein Spo0J